MYFVANDDVHGNELWRTDGTNEGTTLVNDIYPGLPSANSNPHRLTVVGDRLFFNAYNATTQSPETVFYIDAAAPTTVQRAKRAARGQQRGIPAVGPIFGAPNGRLVISRLLGESSNCCYAVYALAPGRHRVRRRSRPAPRTSTQQQLLACGHGGRLDLLRALEHQRQPGPGR